jgi:DNA-binding IclR family transcriptional regulator
MSNTLQSVDRAVRILLSFEKEGEEATVGALASLLGVHKSTASRLTATLRKHGLLERSPHGDGFRLGPELARLGMLAVGGRELADVARTSMAELAAATGETVTLGVLQGEDLVTVAQIDSRHVVGPQNWVGRGSPLHASSDGKVMLAFGGAQLKPGRLEPLTERTHTRRDQLARELEQVRRQGWAQAVGELEHGLHGVAAPVIDASGRCRAVLSVSGPAYRLPAETLPSVGAACRRAADEIGWLLVASSHGAGNVVPVASRRRTQTRGGDALPRSAAARRV